MGTTKCTWIWWLLHRIPHMAILYGWCLGSQIRQPGEMYEECTAQSAWFGRHWVRELSSAQLSGDCAGVQDIWRSEIGYVERALEPFYQMQCGRWGGDYRERFIIIGSLRDHQGYLAPHKEHGRTERSLEVQDIDNFVWHQVLKFPRQSSRHSTTVGGGIILQIGKSNK